MFEVPSNLILNRVGARWWIARIMISWGLITCAFMFVREPWHFYLLRILLGFAEAGFFPGIILYLSYWYPARERARMVAFFMAASPLTGVLGSPLSGTIMDGFDEVAGLSGWQWVFILEGIPAIGLGLAVLWWLTDRPAAASWLAPEERDWLTARLEQEEKYRFQRHGLTLDKAMADRRVWLLIILYFTVAAGSNAFGAYLPTLIKWRSPGLTALEVGLLAAIPNACAVICMVANGFHSDRTGERRWHVAVPAFTAAAGWTVSALTANPILGLVGLSLAQAGMMSMLPTFWTLPGAFLTGVAAAGGIALINSVGNLGGFAGPYIMGIFKTATGSFTGGQLDIACLMFAGGLLAVGVRPDHTSTDKSAEKESAP
jgi:ACS family tartrate transporter-like MFS transporter